MIKTSQKEIKQRWTTPEIIDNFGNLISWSTAARFLGQDYFSATFLPKMRNKKQVCLFWATFVASAADAAQPFGALLGNCYLTKGVQVSVFELGTSIFVFDGILPTNPS